MDHDRSEGQAIDVFLSALPQDVIDKLALETAGSGEDIAEYLPYVSEDVVDELAYRLHRHGLDFTYLLPFMAQDVTDELLTDLAKKQDVHPFLGFASDEVRKSLETGSSTTA